MPVSGDWALCFFAAAKQLSVSPKLMAATNSSRGVMGRMISPQNIGTGTATSGLADHRGAIFARTFRHSFIFILLLGGAALLEQYVFPGVIPF
jgi:lactate permease